MRFPTRFRFRLIPALTTLALVAIGLTLANWQMQRALQKEAIEQRIVQMDALPPLEFNAASAPIDPNQFEYRRLRLTGEFIESWPVYLDNRPYRGVAGFYLLMPFRIENSNRIVLIERGWLPRNPDQRQSLPRLNTPPGLITLQGRVRRDTGHLLQLGVAASLRPSAIVQNLSLAEFSQAAKLPLQPFVLEQLSDIADGLQRDWPRPSTGADRHWGYAVQWLALALTALIFFIVTGFKRAPTT